MPKLTIELVPLTCWYANVRKLVTYSQWEVIKHVTRQAAHSICQICGGVGERWPVECHELWQYNDETHIQTLVGLIALCPMCHMVKHFGHTAIIGYVEAAEAHLAEVNGWDAKTTKDYIDNAFAEWQRRSQYKWQLDLSWLQKTFGIEISISPKEMTT